MKVSEKEVVVQSGKNCVIYTSVFIRGICQCCLHKVSYNAVGEILYGKRQRNSSVCAAGPKETFSTFQSSQEVYVHKINLITFRPAAGRYEISSRH
jgi:hypothetical protein